MFVVLMKLTATLRKLQNDSFTAISRITKSTDVTVMNVGSSQGFVQGNTGCETKASKLLV
jgi:hypothetical protein